MLHPTNYGQNSVKGTLSCSVWAICLPFTLVDDDDDDDDDDEEEEEGGGRLQLPLFGVKASQAQLQLHTRREPNTTT